MQEARRFSNLAVWLVAVVALTGVLRAVSELGGLSNLLDGLRASYGLTVLGKVAAGLVLIGLGATNRLRNVAILAEDERPLRRFVGAETVVALGVLVLTGVLTGLSPPVAAASAATGPPPVAGSATGADFATTTRVSLTMTPGFAGPNAFQAEVTDYDSGAPVSADAVTLRFQSVTHPDLPVSQIRLTQQMDHQGMSSPGMDGIWVGQGNRRLGHGDLEGHGTHPLRREHRGGPDDRDHEVRRNDLDGRDPRRADDHDDVLPGRRLVAVLRRSGHGRPQPRPRHRVRTEPARSCPSAGSSSWSRPTAANRSAPDRAVQCGPRRREHHARRRQLRRGHRRDRAGTVGATNRAGALTIAPAPAG